MARPGRPGVPGRHPPWRARNRGLDMSCQACDTVVIRPGGLATPSEETRATAARARVVIRPGGLATRARPRPGPRPTASSSALEGSQPGFYRQQGQGFPRRHPPWRARNARCGHRRRIASSVVIRPGGLATTATRRPGRPLAASSSALEGSQHGQGEPGRHLRARVVIRPGGLATRRRSPRPWAGPLSSSALEGSQRKLARQGYGIPVRVVIRPGGLATAHVSSPCRCRRGSSSALEGSQLQASRSYGNLVPRRHPPWRARNAK